MKRKWILLALLICALVLTACSEGGEGGVWKSEQTTDSDTGMITELSYNNWETIHTTTVFAPDKERIISYEGYREDGTYSWKYLYDDNEFRYYAFYDDERERVEMNFTATGGDRTQYIKWDGTTVKSTFKTIVNGDAYQYYYLTVDSPYYSKIYTYPSDEAVWLTRFQCTDYRYGTYEDWTLDGGGKDTDNILSLTLTENGVTTYYIHDEVPWGKGMMYPPKNPGDFCFSY